ncbi:hypothetical protein D3C79_1000610 [compost metagenome]
MASMAARWESVRSWRRNALALESRNLRNANIAEDLPLLLAPTRRVVVLARSIRTDRSLRKFAISKCWICMVSSL